MILISLRKLQSETSSSLRPEPPFVDAERQFVDWIAR
jgi:hypothetical protein